MQQYLDPLIQHYTEAFAEQQAAQTFNDDMTWLQSLQMKAIAAFQQLGLPTRKVEDWKYTNLNSFQKHEFTAQSPQQDNISPAQFVPYLIEPDCFRIILINGHFNSALSQIEDLPAGLEILPLQQALQTRSAMLKLALEQHQQQLADPFKALNTAMLGNGLFIHLADNVQLSKPIHIIHLGVGSALPPANHSRQIIIADRSSQALVMESFISLNSQDVYFTNTMTDIHIAPNAFIEHVKLQQESLEAFHIGTLTGWLDRDSTLNSYSLSFGGKLVRSDCDVLLNDTNAHCGLNGLFMVTDSQHVDHHTRVDHFKPHGSSNQQYRGILSDKATGVFNGKVYVHPDAQKTQAEQSNKNILLSPGAEMNTKPDLEIYADDVKCAHGATVGQLDDKQLFYLQARGLSYPEAQHLLTYAFASTILNQLPSVALNQYAQTQLLAKLPQGEALKDLLS